MLGLGHVSTRKDAYRPPPILHVGWGCCAIRACGVAEEATLRRRAIWVAPGVNPGLRLRQSWTPKRVQCIFNPFRVGRSPVLSPGVATPGYPNSSPSGNSPFGRAFVSSSTLVREIRRTGVFAPQQSPAPPGCFVPGHSRGAIAPSLATETRSDLNFSFR